MPDFVQEIAATVIRFHHLVSKVIEKYTMDFVLIRSTLRFLQHHLPESCYFLSKLAGISSAVLELPGCKDLLNGYQLYPWHYMDERPS